MADPRPGEIPPSNALTEIIEAEPESLSVLFARDPEGYTTQDLDRVIQALRDQRQRWEAVSKAEPVAAAKPKKGPKSPLNQIAGAGVSAADLFDA